MSGKYAPLLGVVPMTIVAFMRESEDSILLAADQQYSGEGYRTFYPKLRQAGNQQIAWSSAGNPQIGLEEFGEWINKYDFEDKNWGGFVLNANSQLSVLNGERKRTAELSGYEFKPEIMAAELLIAGWLKGVPGAFQLNNQGGYFSVLRYNFETIGSGGTSAHVARVALHMCNKELEPITILRFVMDSVAAHVNDCSRPIDMWRITENSVEVIMGKQKNTEKGVSAKQIHGILDKVSQPIKKSEKEKS